MLHDHFRIQRIFSRWRVRPCFGEGARSYFSRLVMDGEEISPRAFAERSDLYQGGDPLQQILKAVTDLPISEDERTSLIRWTPIPASGANKRSAAPKSSRRSLRYCPQCISEAPYHRSWWDVRSLTRCVFHGTTLRLGEGDSSYPFYGNLKGGLEVGRSFHPNDGSYDCYQLQRMGIVEPLVPRPLLDDTPFDVVVHLVERVGRLLAQPKMVFAPRTSRSSQLIGFEALESDTEHLENRFAEWLAANNTPEQLQRGNLSNYGWAEHIGIYLYAMRDTELFRNVSIAQIRACGRHGILSRNFLRRDELGLPATLKEAFDEFDLTPHSFRRWLKRAGIVPTKANGFETLTDTDLALLRSEFATTCSVEEASRTLQLTRKEMKSLGRYRILDYLNLQGQGDAGLLFFRPQVEGLLDRFQFPPPKKRSKPLPFKEFVRRTKRTRILVARDVLEGRRTCSRIPGGLGFDSLRFEMTSRDPGNRNRGKPARIGRKELSNALMIRAEFTALTGIPSRGIMNLVRSGHLISDHEAGAPLDRAVAMDFHGSYINAYRFLRSRGMKLAQANAEIERLGMARAFEHEHAQAILIDRETFEAKLGIENPGTDGSVKEVWSRLLTRARRNCPSFVFPPVPVECRSSICTATRKSGFMIDLDGTDISFQVTMDKDASFRLWKLYLKEDELRSILPSFEWKRDCGRVEGKVIARSDEDLDRITRELGKISEAFAYKMP